MPEATHALYNLSRMLAAHSIELRTAAATERDRGAVIREVSRQLRRDAAWKRAQAQSLRSSNDLRLRNTASLPSRDQQPDP
jgi:hypothetical protein